jgi:hypothetical protein
MNSEMETRRLDEHDLLQLEIASKIAGGMAAHSEAYEGHDWQGSIARCSWSVAGKLILLARSGGC